MGEEPLLQKLRIQQDIESDKKISVNDGEGDGPVTLVLLFTTLTALCGMFSYGTAAGFTSPAQAGIMEELNLSLVEFSFFASVLTIGGLVGAAMSGRLADVFARRGALWVSNSFCMVGWLMIAFSQVGIGLLALQQLGGLSGYTFYMSLIFHKSGIPNNVGVMVSTVVQSTMSVFGLLIVEKYGRRSLLTIATVMMCVGSLITGLSFLFQSYALLNNYTPISTFIGVMVFTISITIGVGGISGVIVLRGRLCNLTSWSCNWFVSYTFNFLFQWSPSGVFFYIYSMISGAGILFVMKMVPRDSRWSFA